MCNKCNKSCACLKFGIDCNLLPINKKKLRIMHFLGCFNKLHIIISTYFYLSRANILSAVSFFNKMYLCKINFAFVKRESKFRIKSGDVNVNERVGLLV